MSKRKIITFCSLIVILIVFIVLAFKNKDGIIITKDMYYKGVYDNVTEELVLKKDGTYRYYYKENGSLSTTGNYIINNDSITLKGSRRYNDEYYSKSDGEVSFNIVINKNSISEIKTDDGSLVLVSIDDITGIKEYNNLEFTSKYSNEDKYDNIYFYKEWKSVVNNEEANHEILIALKGDDTYMMYNDNILSIGNYEINDKLALNQITTYNKECYKNSNETIEFNISYNDDKTIKSLSIDSTEIELVNETDTLDILNRINLLNLQPYCED